jgi:hypothetical protein
VPRRLTGETSSQKDEAPHFSTIRFPSDKTTMGKQYNKTIKRRRRKAYVARKMAARTAAVKTKVARPKKPIADPSAEKPGKEKAAPTRTPNNTAPAAEKPAPTAPEPAAAPAEGAPAATPETPVSAAAPAPPAAEETTAEPQSTASE